VMYKGHIVAMVRPDEVTREEIGLLMAGAEIGERSAPPAPPTD